MVQPHFADFVLLYRLKQINSSGQYSFIKCNQFRGNRGKRKFGLCERAPGYLVRGEDGKGKIQ